MATPMNPKTRSIFAQRLREARLAKGLSQMQLARRMVTNEVCISEWENDRRRPQIATLSRIAKALDVRADWLLGGDV